MAGSENFHLFPDSKGETETPHSFHILDDKTGNSIWVNNQDTKVTNFSLPALALVGGWGAASSDSSNAQGAAEGAGTDSSTQKNPSMFSEVKAALPDLWSGAKDEVLNHPWQVAKNFGEGVAEGAIATAAVVGIAAISVPAAIGTAVVAGGVGLAIGTYEAGSALTKWVNAGGTLESPSATTAQTEAAQSTLFAGGHAVADTGANIIGGVTGAGAAALGMKFFASASAAAASTVAGSDSTAPIPKEVSDSELFESVQSMKARAAEQFPHASGADQSFAEFLTAQAMNSGYPDTAVWATHNLTDPEQIGQFVDMYAKNGPLALKNMENFLSAGQISEGTGPAWNVGLAHAYASVGDKAAASWYGAAAKRS
jgi:hypothetical protein